MKISIRNIDQLIGEEKDTKNKNKLIKIRGNILHRIQLNATQTKFIKSYGII